MIRAFFLALLFSMASLSAEEWDVEGSGDDIFYTFSDTEEEYYGEYYDEDYLEEECNNCCCYVQEPLFHKFAIGPQVYTIARRRAGGSRQDGAAYGMRICYDRIKPFGIYWGAEWFYGTGTLNGKTNADNKLCSTLTDKQIEGRLGFTFQSSRCHQPSFTPFVGYGYFRETNKYRSPSPMTLNFVNQYPYIAAGFLSNIDINNWLQIGINLKGRILWNGAKCVVSGDPEFDKETMPIGSRFNYRVEFPVLYQSCGERHRFGCGLVPFFERRHYGGAESFPHDFFDTRLTIYGLIIEVTYQL